jgi:hypothetical protein
MMAAESANTPCPDLPHWHPRHVAVLLAGQRHQPDEDAKVITVPPQMVATTCVPRTGYCVGEPWNHRAIIMPQVTAITTQDI